MPRPEEGLIHAWLDGQLPPDEAARVEQLAATDPEWGAAVAEARGFIAASSRILSSLDQAPAGVIPRKQMEQPAWRMPWWTKVAAAIVVVAGGSVLVFQRANLPEVATAPAATPIGSAASAPTVNAPLATSVPAVPAEKKLPRSPAPAAQRAAAEETKNAERAIAPRAAVADAPVSTLTAEARQKAELADRIAPPAAPPVLAKDVAAKVADSAQRKVAQAVHTVGGVSAMAAAGGVPKQARAAEPAAAELQAARRVSGVAAAPAPVNAKVPSRGCYRVREANAPTDAGIIMRMVNTDGDTLRLETAQGSSGLRAWIVWRDSLGHGAMTAADGKGAVAIVASVSTCPAP